MKILVIEDNERQQMLARKQLVEHDVTVIASYPEAFRLMKTESFDALLTDLNLLATSEYPLNGRFDGQEVQAGWAMVIQAISLEIPRVGLLTNANHHKDTASSLVDLFKYRVMTIGKSRVFFDNENCINFRDEDGLVYGDKLWNKLLQKVWE